MPNDDERVVAYDVTRLINRRRALFPTGIDLIDLWMAMGVLKRFGKACLPVAQSQSQTCVVDRRLVQDLLVGLRGAWLSGQPPPEEAARALDWNGISSKLGYGPQRDEHAALARMPSLDRTWLLARELGLVATRLRQRRRLAARAKRAISEARAAIYVNASHEGLIRQSRALAQFFGSIPHETVSYIHDLMPIEYPEYSRADQIKSLKSILSEVLCHPVTFAVNSQATTKSLSAHLTNRTVLPEQYLSHVSKLAAEPIVIYPGVDTEYGGAGVGTQWPRAPYFVILGTIEPRKNHLMLLHIWRDMKQDRIVPMPHLFIVGRRGWDIGNVTAMIERCEPIRPHVTELNNLDNVGVANLLRGARALLFPSFAEGFGLPLTEAAALKVPVIASDLDVFREVAAQGVLFIDPLDAKEWKNAILRASEMAGNLAVPKLVDGLGDWLAQSERFADLVEARLAVL